MTTDKLTYEQKIALTREYLAEAFAAASAQYGLNRRDLSRLAVEIAFSSAASPQTKCGSRKTEASSQKLPLPPEAPERWRNRDLNRRENAPRFIRRVYAQWLGRGLGRTDLAELDYDLYKAFSVWVSRHPDDPIIDLLPPQKERLDDLIEHLSKDYPLDLLRRLGHAIDGRLRRKASL